MPTTTLVSMDEQGQRTKDKGRLTVLAAARQELWIEGATEFELEVTGDTVVPRPAATAPPEGARAYTPEHSERVERARRAACGGKVVPLKVDELARPSGE